MSRAIYGRVLIFTSFCKVFLIRVLLLPSPRPFTIGASKSAIGLQEYLGICLKCWRSEYSVSDSPFLVLGCKLHVEQVARQGGHHHICLLPLEIYSSNFSSIKIHLDHVPILVDFVVRAEPLPTICRPAAHDGSYVLCSVVLFGHI